MGPGSLVAVPQVVLPDGAAVPSPHRYLINYKVVGKASLTR